MTISWKQNADISVILYKIDLKKADEKQYSYSNYNNIFILFMGVVTTF